MHIFPQFKHTKNTVPGSLLGLVKSNSKSNTWKPAVYSKCGITMCYFNWKEKLCFASSHLKCVFFHLYYFFTSLLPNLLSSVCKDSHWIHGFNYSKIWKTFLHLRKICCKLDFGSVLICSCSMSQSKLFLVNLQSGWGTAELKIVVLESLKCLSTLQEPFQYPFSYCSPWLAY